MRFVFSVSLWAIMASGALAQSQHMVSGPEEYNPPGMEPSANSFEPTTEASGSDSGGGWDYDWSGSYFGVAAGYAVGSQEAHDIAAIVSGSEVVHGRVFNGYAGSNTQISRLVFGAELEISQAAVTGEFTLPGSAWACGSSAFNCTTEVGWNGSLRGRAGIAFNSFLPYVTVGGTLARTKSTFNGPLGLSETVSGVGYGFVAGLGLEYALMKNLVLRAEGVHYELSDVAERFGIGEAGTSANFNVLRVGASLKF